MIFQTLGFILKSSFKPGFCQMHKNWEDIFHYGQKVGEGIYFTPDIKLTENYSWKVVINGDSYKVALMVRVKPDKIRVCSCENKAYWVLNGNCDEVRPYRILFKKC